MSELIKKSYHLGINKYPAKIWGKGANLKGCVNDRDTMYDIFTANGFVAEKLSETTTTIDFKKLLTSFIGLKGVICVTFSGHGTFYDKPLADNTTERITGVCLTDEVFWDFEYRKIISQFDKDLTLLWFSDSCYSEDNFKSLNPSNNVAIQKYAILPKNITETVVKATVPVKAAIKCTIIAFSAADKWQPGFDAFLDLKNQGAFTYCLNKVYKKYGSTLSYYDYIMLIKKEIKESGFNQDPQLQITVRKGTDVKAIVNSKFLQF